MFQHGFKAPLPLQPQIGVSPNMASVSFALEAGAEEPESGPCCGSSVSIQLVASSTFYWTAYKKLYSTRTVQTQSPVLTMLAFFRAQMSLTQLRQYFLELWTRVAEPGTMRSEATSINNGFALKGLSQLFLLLQPIDGVELDGRSTLRSPILIFSKRLRKKVSVTVSSFHRLSTTSNRNLQHIQKCTYYLAGDDQGHGLPLSP